jgi:hypothetical protein
VFADFLRKVWRDKIVFHNLNQPRPGRSYEGGQRARRVSLVLSNDLKEKLERRTFK